MPVYEATVDSSSSGTSHGHMLDLIGGNKTVLDVGCATGYLARALVERGCTVSGVELEPEAAEQARPVLRRLVVGDLAALDLDAELEHERFDVVVLGDILEHLVDPVRLLRQAVGLLEPGGSVVISIPHVAHGSLRLALLQGRWEYLDRGLLDRTHLRFFTRRSLVEMLAEAGLVVAEMHPTVLDPLGSEVRIDVDGLPAGVVDWVRQQPDATVYQFVLRAVRDDAHGLVESVRAERDDLRTQVDGLRAQVSTAQAERDAALADANAIRSTVTWRLATPLRATYRRIRAATGAGRWR
jgi:2-polyprenyl-3-methyl-5-hydroxy-6-metoxy-1,4-benzoquinol methylase